MRCSHLVYILRHSMRHDSLDADQPLPEALSKPVGHSLLMHVSLLAMGLDGGPHTHKHLYPV